MAASVPRYSIAKHQPNHATNGNPAVKAASPRMKVVLRRLPPGLTDNEFYTAIGEEWKAGGERVDWASYKPGKISKDLAKPSRPTRVYLHLVKQDYLGALSDKVRETIFVDSKGSNHDPSLLGPPNVEFAPYGRVPGSKIRKDGRQGTIDQDLEFIDFLESLTNPVSKPGPVEAGNDAESKKGESVAVTPLIQFLRDKKINKGKEPSATGKTSQHSRQDSKDGKTSQGSEKKASAAKGSKDPSPTVEKRSASAIRVEKAARDAVKVLNKQALAGNRNTSNPPAPAQLIQVIPSQPASAAPVIERKRERGSGSAVARIIQRDLGLAANPGGRRRRDGAANTTNPSSIPNTPKQPSATATATASASQTAAGKVFSPSPSSVALPSTPSSSTIKTTLINDRLIPALPPTGPAASRSTPKPNSQSNSASKAHQVSAPALAKPALPQSTSTQAFLKHANPSQGITEPLLDAAFSPFGTISKVEIDKKKGFAYIDFVEPESLHKAIAASPVKVAQGQVVVLERKTGLSLQARNVRGGATLTSGGRGGAPAGGTPTGPRGGRGGSVRGRGGAARGGAGVLVSRPADAATSANTSTALHTTAVGASPRISPVVSLPARATGVAPAVSTTSTMTSNTGEQ